MYMYAASYNRLVLLENCLTCLLFMFMQRFMARLVENDGDVGVDETRPDCSTCIAFSTSAYAGPACSLPSHNQQCSSASGCIRARWSASVATQGHRHSRHSWRAVQGARIARAQAFGAHAA